MDFDRTCFMKKADNKTLHIIGAGLAGSEAAWQAANMGVDVILHEMRPTTKTAAHQNRWVRGVGLLQLLSLR